MWQQRNLERDSVVKQTDHLCPSMASSLKGKGHHSENNLMVVLRNIKKHRMLLVQNGMEGNWGNGSVRKVFTLEA